MKKSSSLFFQSVIVLIGIGVFGFLLWEPLIEGRNAHATLFEVYFNDLFLVYAYTASIPFFVGLYQAFKAVGYAAQNEGSSQEIVKALRTIKYCAIIIIGFIIVGENMFILFNDSDDRAGGVFMGVLISVISTGIAVVAGMFERTMRNRMRITSAEPK